MVFVAANIQGLGGAVTRLPGVEADQQLDEPPSELKAVNNRNLFSVY